MAWLNKPGFHGFSEMLYEFTSGNADNGSGFVGLGDNPTILVKNPVMFTVEIGTLIMVFVTIYITLSGDTTQRSLVYGIIINTKKP